MTAANHPIVFPAPATTPDSPPRISEPRIAVCSMRPRAAADSKTRGTRPERYIEGWHGVMNSARGVDTARAC